MTREDLFLAIGQVEESRLARTEWNVQTPSPAMEDSDMKKRRSSKRIFRNLLIAAVIVSMLAVTAYAVAAFVIFESPEEMVMAVFGDKTGFDHKGVTTWTDPYKPGSVYENPAYDRVPVDETVMEEDIIPYVTAVGKSISYDGYTVTVDAVMYDSTTRCGMVTYLLTNPNGVGGYELQNNGMLWNGAAEIVDFNQYGYPYIIQEKTTDTQLAAVYYFRITGYGDETLNVDIYEGVELSDEEIAEMNTQIRAEFTEEEALEYLKEAIGDANYNRQSVIVKKEEWIKVAYDQILMDRRDALEHPGRIQIVCNQESKLNHVTLGDGSVTITPICFQIDASKLDFLQENAEGMDTMSADNVDTVEIVYKDGSRYEVRKEGLDNTLWGLISESEELVPTEIHVYPDQDPEGIGYTTSIMGGNHCILTYMFNRIIDVDAVSSVLINGVELPVD